jgi:hypothetical protein
MLGRNITVKIHPKKRYILNIALGVIALGTLAFGISDDGPFTGVETFEDGSGIQYIEDQEVRTFPVGTFAWDCTRMGNSECEMIKGLTMSENVAELREGQR